EREGAAELLDRAVQLALRPVDAPEVAVWEVPWLVALGGDRALEPRNRVVELALLEEVRADVVVRVAEIRIDLDRLLALGDGVVELVLEAVGPPQEGVRLCRRVARDRLEVALDRGVELTGHLQLVRL